MEMTTISSDVLACMKKFRWLFEVLHFSTHNTDDFPDESAWRDEAGRFRIWASNLGAHQKGQSSLDYRLRDASHIKDQILDLLADLEVVLKEAIKIMQFDGKPGNAQVDARGSSKGS